MFKRALTLVCCTLLFAIFSVRADEWNKRTVVTFNQPVELPHIVLPPGTYVFKLLDSTSDRHIVQIFNKEETHIFATILAIPNYRLEPTGETVMKFTERAAGSPQAMRAWFYPGDNFGQEFVYPKARAVTMAAEVKEPVLAAPITPEEKPQELEAAPVETVAPPEVALETPPEAPAAPAVVEPEPTPAPVEAPVMPKTASPMPAVAVFGMASLALALLLKRVS